MSEQGKGARGKLDPLPQIKPYDPFAYNAFDLPDPFKPRKIEPTKGASKLAPDLTRRKEPLEAFPLESLSMVGTLEKNKTIFALVRTPDRDVYQVRAGNYLGQNFGVVTGIGEGEVKLKELVQDGAGDWTERSSTLQLQQAEARPQGQKMSASIGNRFFRSARAWRRGLRPRLPRCAHLACASVALAQEANSLDGVTVSRASSGRIVVRFQLKNPPANPPASFSIQSPPRIALDFLDTGNGLGATQRAVDEAALRSLNVIQAGNRTRVVFNLNKPQSFETSVEGNTVIVTLNDQEAVKPGTDTVQRFAEAKTGEAQHALRDVDFRRGRNGEGRLVVDLSDSSTGIDIRQQGKTLVVDFLKTSLPRNLERRIDVADFGTPVLTVDTFPQGSNARMVIEPKGLWEHSAYQTDNRFILEIKPIQEDPNKLIQGSRGGYKGEKLSLNFQNVEVRAVLQVIADFTGLNIITSDTVQGSLTLRLKDIPWDQALDIILQTKGLDMRKNGNVVLIAPREELALKEKQQLENAIQIGELEPLISESFQLNYIKAQDLLNLITTQPPAAIRRWAPGRRRRRAARARSSPSAAWRSSTRARTSCSSQDTAARLEEVRKIIRQIDTPIRQVLIEARIVIASDRFSQQLGVRFGQQTGFTFLNSKYAAGSSGSLSTQPVVTTRKATADPRDAHADAVRTGVGTRDRRLFRLAAVEREPAGAQRGRPARADADQPRQRQPHQPRAVGAGGRCARQGRVESARGHRRQPEGGDRAGHGNSVCDAGQRQLAGDRGLQEGGAAARRHAADHRRRPHHHGGRGAQGHGRPVRAARRRLPVPSIDTKNVVTQISVNNGDTAVIGGIYEETIRNDVTQVPWLGNIPMLGYLFKQTGNSSEKAELLIFLTPRIVKDTVTSVR